MGIVVATVPACTLPAATGTVGATPLRPAKTLDCTVGVGYCISWAMGECGPRGNPDGVSYCCRVGACTCAAIPGAAIGALTLPCELISSSSTILTVGCPLICTSSQGTVSQQALLHCLTTYTTAANPKHATCRFLKYYHTSSRRASVHWFLKTSRVVRIFLFQRLRAFSCVRHRCTLCSPSNNCFLRVGYTSDVF